MDRRFLLHIVVAERPVVLELLPGKDETLLVRRNAFLVGNLRLDGRNRVGRLNLYRNCLAGERFYKDLHLDIRRYNFLNKHIDGVNSHTTRLVPRFFPHE